MKKKNCPPGTPASSDKQGPDGQAFGDFLFILFYLFIFFIFFFFAA